MHAVALPLIQAVQAELQQHRLGVDAAELHGALCGFVCAGGTPQASRWLEQLAIEGADTIGEQGALQQLLAASCAQLADDELGFELLLPDDEVAIAQRAQALVSWCSGFLGGFGLVAEGASGLSVEAVEALQDLGKIAATQLSFDDPESDAEAYEEVAEFVRVAALLIYSERHSSPPAGSSVH